MMQLFQPKKAQKILDQETFSVQSCTSNTYAYNILDQETNSE